MNILIIAPYTGGIDVYVRALKNGLEMAGAKVTIDGGTENESPYNKSENKFRSSEEVKALAEKIVDRIDFSKFDLVAFHYGKNDIEQYLPVILKKRNIFVPNPIYFVHYLSRNLFSHYLNDKNAQDEVEKATANFFTGYVFFGQFPRDFMEKQLGRQLPGVIAYHPEAHSHSSIPDYLSIVKKIIPSELDRNLPTSILSGFASNYKDHELLIDSLKFVNKPMNLLFSGPGWFKRLQFENKKNGVVNVFVRDKYLDESEFLVSVKETDFGIFPYHQPMDKTEIFQGSGALPNYLYQGKPCIVLNDGVMAEYVGNAGIVVKSISADELGSAINTMLADENIHKYSEKSKMRSHLFSQKTHGKTCYDYFSRLIKGKD